MSAELLCIFFMPLKGLDGLRPLAFAATYYPKSEVGALAAPYTAAMYSSCGYPFVFNPLAVC